METINAKKTMKTIKTTKAELVTLINGLYAIQEVPGKKFSLAVSKNIEYLKETLKDVEEAGTPSEEFLKIANEVNEIANKKEEGGKEKIEQLEKDNKKLVDARRKQLEEVEKLMKEEAEVNLVMIDEDMLPETITAKQINGIIKIIE
tara:strand:+ start:7195 stop:7635 length:441 start_codon:yes stop_codon:yes gene_type:complete